MFELASVVEESLGFCSRIVLETCEMQEMLRGRKGYHKKGKICKRLKSQRSILVFTELWRWKVSVSLRKSSFLFLSSVLRGAV